MLAEVTSLIVVEIPGEPISVEALLRANQLLVASGTEAETIVLKGPSTEGVDAELARATSLVPNLYIVRPIQIADPVATSFLGLERCLGKVVWLALGLQGLQALIDTAAMFQPDNDDLLVVRRAGKSILADPAGYVMSRRLVHCLLKDADPRALMARPKSLLAKNLVVRDALEAPISLALASFFRAGLSMAPACIATGGFMAAAGLVDGVYWRALVSAAWLPLAVFLPAVRRSFLEAFRAAAAIERPVAGIAGEDAGSWVSSSVQLNVVDGQKMSYGRSFALTARGARPIRIPDELR